MDIESIKQLIKNGDFPQAHDQLAQILSRTPDDTVAQMLYGTCCQVMGDSETFSRIYQRLAPEMERCVERGERSERTTMWIKYAAMFAMILTLGFNAGCVRAVPLYAGPPDAVYDLNEETGRKQIEEARKRRERKTEMPSQPESSPEPIHTKYGGPSFGF